MYKEYKVERIGIHSESCQSWRDEECTCGLNKENAKVLVQLEKWEHERRYMLDWWGHSYR